MRDRFRRDDFKQETKKSLSVNEIHKQKMIVAEM